jgi:hypothetical protein
MNCVYMIILMNHHHKCTINLNHEYNLALFCKPFQIKILAILEFLFQINSDASRTCKFILYTYIRNKLITNIFLRYQ